MSGLTVKNKVKASALIAIPVVLTTVGLVYTPGGLEEKLMVVWGFLMGAAVSFAAGIVFKKK